ncbi:MAG: pyridoxal-phosphate dependent enzyme [Candidatus Delongbacteria bacterium]|nr:pyridoxal-phosphate dependent enzyme [bacterium]MBL7033531.1 pyridoxal-phosphate dependent enzyme [Candidatus Delongbacteria bacterium]
MQHKLIYNDILETIGNTPLVRLSRLQGNLPVELLGKLERSNPGGSIKDRIALSLVEAAERTGKLRPGGTIVEATSGNMGIGLALVAARKDYRCIIVMPWKMSAEREQIVRSLGGEVVRVPTEVPPEHPDSFLSTARRIAETTPNAILINQFCNQENPATHYRTTGPEIWEQTGGKVDAFVMGMGTGGTISGVGRFLKEQKPSVRIVGAEPEGSIIKTYFDTGEKPEGQIYLVEGIGEDFLPESLQLQWVDEMRWVSDQAAFDMTLRLAREEGIFCGGSSGAQIQVALEVAAELPPGSTIVTTLPDTGSRYLSKLYNDSWLVARGLKNTADLTAGGLVTITGRPFYTCNAETPLLEALARMDTHNLEVLPVLEGSVSSGTLYRDELVTLLLQGRELSGGKVGEWMQPPLPLVASSLPLAELQPVLAATASVLVNKGESYIGVIQRQDIYRFL